jgi:hypothetical protein
MLGFVCFIPLLAASSINEHQLLNKYIAPAMAAEQSRLRWRAAARDGSHARYRPQR